MVAPTPDSASNRVLVGPFRTAAELADTRTAAWKRRVSNPIVRKY